MKNYAKLIKSGGGAFFATICAAALAGAASADVYWWTGATDANWAEAGNWSPQGGAAQGYPSGTSGEMHAVFSPSANATRRNVSVGSAIQYKGHLLVGMGSIDDPVVISASDASYGVRSDSDDTSYFSIGYGVSGTGFPASANAALKLSGGTYGPWKKGGLLGSSSGAKSGWLILDGKDVGTTFKIGKNDSSAYTAFKVYSGGIYSTNANFVCEGRMNLSNVAGGKAVVDKVNGDWTFLGSFNGRLIVGATGGANAEFYNRGGSVDTVSYIVVGAFGGSNVQSNGWAYFEMDGGLATNRSQTIIVGDSGVPGDRSVMNVKNGIVAPNTDFLVGNGGAGTLLMNGGVVDASRGSVIFCNSSGCAAGENCAIILSNGVVRTKAVTYGSGSASASVTFAGGTLRAAAAGTLIAANNNLTVAASESGGAIDTAGYAVTIAEDIGDAAGETGTLTFSGIGGKANVTGSLNYTGVTKVAAGTELVVKDENAKNALLSNGLMLVRGVSGTSKFLAIADGTHCTAEDCARIVKGAGLESGATFGIDANGAITVTVSHVSQIWAGAAGVSAAWSGGNWDDGDVFQDGNDAVFETSGAIAEVDADYTAFSLTFSENATLAGTGRLSVPTVTVGAGKTASISGPLAGAVDKTGAGTLVLGSSRSETTTLTEGTLAMANGATVVPTDAKLKLGTDAAKPVVFDYGAQTLSAAPSNYIGVDMDVTLTNGTFRNNSDIGFSGSTSASKLTIAKGATLSAGTRFSWNVGDKTNTVNVVGGVVMAENPSSNNYFMQASDKGRLNVNVTDGGLMDFAGALYVMTCIDGDYTTPSMHWTFGGNSTLRTRNNKNIHLGNQGGSHKRPVSPTFELAMTNSTIDVGAGYIYLGYDGYDATGEYTSGHYVADFENCIITARQFSVYHDRPLNAARFNGTTFVATGDSYNTIESKAAFDTLGGEWAGRTPVVVDVNGLTIDTQGYGASLAANPQGAGAITKKGSGTLTLRRNQTNEASTATFVVEDGTLAFASGITNTRPITVKSGATLLFSAGYGGANKTGAIVIEKGASLSFAYANVGYGTVEYDSLDLPTGEGETVNVVVTGWTPGANATNVVKGFAVTPEQVERFRSPCYTFSSIGGELAIALEPKTTTWTGGAGDGLWSSDDNWDMGHPTTRDTVIFNPDEGVVVECTNDVAGLSVLTLLQKDGDGIVKIAGLGRSGLRPKLALNAGTLVATAKDGEEYVLNPFSMSKNQMLVKGILDLDGGVQTNCFSDANNLIADGAVFTNGMFAVTNSNRWLMSPLGTVTVAKDAVLDLGDGVDKNQLNASKTGEARFVVDGGCMKVATTRDEDNTGHYWGNGDNNDAVGVIEVKNGGSFIDDASQEENWKRNNFILGRWFGKTGVKGVLLGNDSPDGGFRFAGRVYAGCGGTGVIAVTNCAFSAMTISVGYPEYLGDFAGAHSYAALSFAGGSVVTTRGFWGCTDTRGVPSDVTFDDAKVVIVETGAADPLNVQTNIFGVAGFGTTYTVAAGGLELNTDVAITNQTTLVGEGGVTVSGGGTVFFTADQSYAGTTTLKSGVTFNAIGRTFAGPVVVEENATVERPSIPAGAKSVRIMRAASFSGAGLEGCDAAGNGFFVFGKWLRYGQVSGFTLIMR